MKKNKKNKRFFNRKRKKCLKDWVYNLIDTFLKKMFSVFFKILFDKLF